MNQPILTIVVPPDPAACDLEFIEVENGKPVRPGRIPDRLRALKGAGRVATLSPVVEAAVGWLVRRGEWACQDVCFAFPGLDRTVTLDVEGQPVEWWPEPDGFDSFTEAIFHYRYAKGGPR
jgi:hypothetical protein